MPAKRILPPLLSEANFREAIHEGLADIKADRTIPHEKIRERLLSWDPDHELPPPKAG
ncbi:hypothetical protein MTBLM1_70144 [Rhodospirillaceae bacterium LM-1]|nr:hypothetical protein MTBLM1_70144 [Rhodospirillaceae bacterium LM-1]